MDKKGNLAHKQGFLLQMNCKAMDKTLAGQQSVMELRTTCKTSGKPELKRQKVLCTKPFLSWHRLIFAFFWARKILDFYSLKGGIYIKMPKRHREPKSKSIQSIIERYTCL